MLRFERYQLGAKSLAVNFISFAALRFQFQPEATMSIFGSIMSAIFGTSAAAQPSGGAAAQASPSTVPSATAGQAQIIDVEKVLLEKAAQNKEKLDWRKSIVDLMKLLNLDSSLSARKELAKELATKASLTA